MPSDDWFRGLIEGECAFSNSVHHGYAIPTFSVSRTVALFLRGRIILVKRHLQFDGWCKRFGLLDDSLYRLNGMRIRRMLRR